MVLIIKQAKSWQDIYYNQTPLIMTLWLHPFMLLVPLGAITHCSVLCCASDWFLCHIAIAGSLGLVFTSCCRAALY